MRVAYLTEWSPFGETGVLRKLIGQVETWRELGCEAEIFALAPRRDEAPSLGFERYGSVIGAIHQSSLEKHPAARLGFFNKIASAPLVSRALRRFAPDVIYYRQNGPWYPGIGAQMRIAPTVMEINTDEGAENSHWGAAFDALYRLTQQRVVGPAAGFVAVTEEIAAKYRDRHKPVAVVPNSFWGEAPGPIAPTAGGEPTFVFVGSPGMSWHGVDKIFLLARGLPASRFHIVGFTAADFPGETIPENMVLHGHQTGPELSAIYARSDVGIGTLALHRKGMDEACPLKIREYLMNRLPVIIGYTEAEAALNAAPYVLQLGNDEGNVARNLETIVAFARDWAGRRVEDDLSFLSRSAKESQRLEFLAKVAGKPA
ncbi:MAG TPA: glycosyltransferase [Caulobacteraceae bacterium]